MARPISGTPWPIVTTAAPPEASRYRCPPAVKMKQPSPRTACGYVFRKLRGKTASLVIAYSVSRFTGAPGILDSTIPVPLKRGERIHIGGHLQARAGHFHLSFFTSTVG